MIKLLELTQDQFVIIDVEDFDWLSKFNWNYSHGYARNGKRKYLHRIIMKAPKGVEIDHINRDKLDCRKSNLRIVNRSLNTFNHGKRKSNTSGIVGVWWCTSHKRWYSEIMVNYKKIRLGSSKEKEIAIALRKAGEAKYYGT